MSSAADGGAKHAGLEALHRLESTEPPLYLTPSPELSKAARLASEYLFASLSPYAPKNPLNKLWTDGFDAEQIWQQIDLQAQPLLSSLRRQVRNFEKNPSEIEKQFNLDKDSGKEENVREKVGRIEENYDESESEDLDDDVDDNDEEEEEEDEEGERGEEDEDDEEVENDEGENGNGVEDKFLKIKELEEYLVEDEAREYGLKKEEKNKRKRGKNADDDEDDENEEGDDDEEDEDDELGLMGLEDDDGSDMENARYEDFFTSQKRPIQKKKPKYEDEDEDDESDDMDMDEPENDDSNQNQKSLPGHEKEIGQLRAKVEEMEKANIQGKTKQSLSTHEKELEKLRAEIEEMERANLEPKTWTMQGEVTAAKRPKNSALEVDMDFEQNARPPPEITVEGTASLEELIMKRIIEGQFDDVQRAPTLLTKAPKEKKELDENKSKKGLAELYEDEYAQKTGLVSAALSFSDEQKKEASMLFKKLCVKLDALSHFHFAPKPVIEDMSIQANVPALAIEEVAPLAVSDASMLAPEELFSGKGDIKEETELSKEDRKRRRAKKKRQFKAKSTKRTAVNAQLNTLKKPDNVAENAES